MSSVAYIFAHQASLRSGSNKSAPIKFIPALFSNPPIFQLFDPYAIESAEECHGPGNPSDGHIFVTITHYSTKRHFVFIHAKSSLSDFLMELCLRSLGSSDPMLSFLYNNTYTDVVKEIGLDEIGQYTRNTLQEIKTRKDIQVIINQAGHAIKRAREDLRIDQQQHQRPATTPDPIVA